jgi:uncharacterized PurR-regulated membrane protein YhhQ (DUF165 family)
VNGLSEIMRPTALFWTASYVTLIVVVNWLFSIVPLVEMGGGDKWPPVALLVGFVFIARDFAQRAIGHWVLAAMAIAAVLSYFMANPFIAYASVAAFAISELADWLVYSFTKRPFAQRILLSSLLASPIDSIVFLGILGILSAPGVLAMTASKLVGALIVWYLVRGRMEIKPAA